MRPIITTLSCLSSLGMMFLLGQQYEKKATRSPKLTINEIELNGLSIKPIKGWRLHHIGDGETWWEGVDGSWVVWLWDNSGEKSLRHEAHGDTSKVTKNKITP